MDPFLKIGVTFAIFQLDGSCDSCRDFLKILHSGALITAAVFTKSFGWRLSEPGDLFGFSLLMAAFNRASVMSMFLKVVSTALLSRSGRACDRTRIQMQRIHSGFRLFQCLFQ